MANVVKWSLVLKELTSLQSIGGRLKRLNRLGRLARPVKSQMIRLDKISMKYID